MSKLQHSGFRRADARERSDRHAFSDFGPSMALQSEKATCDINNILAKYHRTGLITHVNEYKGRYGTFLDAPTYHEAMNQIVRANEMFESLPAGIRSRFGNDPAAFLAFAQDPDNGEELVKLGLAIPRQQEALDAPSAARELAGDRPQESGAAANSQPTKSATARSKLKLASTDE